MPLVAVTRFSPPSVIFYTLLTCLVIRTSRTALGSCYQYISIKTHLGERMEGNSTINKCNPVDNIEDNRNNQIVFPVPLDASNASSIQSSRETHCLSRIDSISKVKVIYYVF